MPNDVTITITVGSSAEGGNVLDGGSDSPPTPLSVDALGTPPRISADSDARSSEAPPAPMPLDRLLSAAQQDSTRPAPSPVDRMNAAGGEDDAPSPMPLDELPPKDTRR